MGRGRFTAAALHHSTPDPRRGLDQEVPGDPQLGEAGLDARERQRDAQELQVHLQPPGNGAQPRG